MRTSGALTPEDPCGSNRVGSESLHPYHRWEVEFRLKREEEIGPQLRALGIGRRTSRCDGSITFTK
jgi:hypothetical protein